MNSLAGILQLLRPHQWLKNLLLFFPPFLGGTLLQIDSYSVALLPFLSFSAGASCIYIINDILDLEQDIHHPRKKLRPLPAGEVTRGVALLLALLLAVTAVVSGFAVSTGFTLILLMYLVISVAYSVRLKTIPIVEIFSVVSGFLLRLMAGGEAFDVHISDWLFLSVFLLALYLIAGKRLGELKHAGGQPPELVRPVLAHYPAGFFEGCMFISGAAVLVTYTMYVISHHGSWLIIPLCCFGLLSYLLRVLSGRGGDPTRALFRDPALLLVGSVWVLLVGWGIYVQ